MQKNDDFKKNPQKESLKNDLKLVQDIIAYQAKGEKLVIEDGVVKVKKGRNYIELGTLTDISALSQELFGEEKPEGVEYLTLGGVTFMTYYGRLIACGDGSQLPDSWAVDLFESINETLENDIIKTIGTVWDVVTLSGMYSNAKRSAKLMEEILRVLDTSKGQEYDGVLDSAGTISSKLSVWQDANKNSSTGILVYGVEGTYRYRSCY